MEQAEVVAGLREERERLTSYLKTLPEGAWVHDSLCEGWQVRDVVSHLTGICADIVNQNFAGLGSVEYNQRHLDDRKDATPEQLLAEWDEKAPICEAQFEAMPPELWNMEMPRPMGSVGLGVLRQLEDLWIHAQDIRIPLGQEPTAGPGLTGTLDLVGHELGRLIGKHAPHVGALELDFADFHTVVQGPGADTIRISGDPVAFALVASGRWSLSASQAEGRLSVEGGELPDRALQIYNSSGMPA